MLDRRAPSFIVTGNTSHSAGETSAGPVGSERVRRHSHRRDQSAPPRGVSRGPRAYRVRIQIKPKLNRYVASEGSVEVMSAIA
ncbi:hypothetical protein M2322_000007 [Rhodoblastus acidophilus]|uniref:hypothetical protein n=1 Tax=Rhodoblastus acidophilus TaxID=1074 RepID=UPI002224318E|nr:hypothetical protein [Rhodoblastus acidophilus]MCW2314487.1 hypothetical protein [Rhodoblastus acidophilus]